MAGGGRRRVGWKAALLIVAGSAGLVLLVTTVVMALGMRELGKGLASLFSQDANAQGSRAGDSDTGPEQVFFLQATGFDPAGPRPAVLLHGLATGGEPLLITDPAVLAAAQPAAYFTDDKAAETRLVLLSILFLSPPGNATSQPFVSLFQNGEEIATLRCFARHCRSDAGMQHRDLAGLIEAGRPAVMHNIELSGGPARIREDFVALQQDPGVWILGSQPIGADTDAYDGSVRLYFRGRILPDTEAEAVDQVAWRADLTRRTEEGLAQHGIPAMIDAVDFDTSWLGLNLRDKATGEIKMTADGYIAGFPSLTVIRPSARLLINEADAPRLRELAPLFALDPMPELPSGAAFAEGVASLHPDMDPASVTFDLRGIPDHLRPGEIGPHFPVTLWVDYLRVQEADPAPAAQ